MRTSTFQAAQVCSVFLWKAFENEYPVISIEEIRSATIPSVNPYSSLKREDWFEAVLESIPSTPIREFLRISCTRPARDRPMGNIFPHEVVGQGMPPLPPRLSPAAN